MRNLSHLLDEGGCALSLTKASTKEADQDQVVGEEVLEHAGVELMRFFFCVPMKKEICFSVEPVLRWCSTSLSVMEQILQLRMWSYCGCLVCYKTRYI